MRLKHVAAASCAALLTVLSLGGTAVATADPTPPSSGDDALVVPVGPAPAAPEGIVEALQRDLGLTRDVAESRLANEYRAAVQEPLLRQRLGAHWAGAWLSGDTARFVIATTDRRDVRAIEANGATARVVPHSLGDLDRVREALDHSARRRAPADTPLWYVDVATNKVVIQSHDPVRTRAFVADSGVDTAAVEILPSAVQPRVLADLRGGDAYNINGNTRCSIGFPITRGTQGGFVTAGHCGRTGSTTTGNGAAQGTFQGSSFPGNDYAWVATNANWTPRALVNRYPGTVPVAGSTQSPAGSSICRSGSTTGWHCGTIQQHNTSVTYPQGTVTGLTRTNVCAEPGDSGGSFISGSQAQGVTSGGSGNCSSGGETYHQPVNEILQTYGLTLTTGGGNPPTGCAGAQNTYSGTLASGAQATQPDNSYYETTTSGTHTGCLTGPAGADFDLTLQKWNGSTWNAVAQGTTPEADETISYNGTAGRYRYIVLAYSGSGGYSLGVSKP
ncbi:S1 family peptidase [Embleya hyalina]|uniref:Serine protease n=1 Tax=Embleya hyalina TaxID=516124 RepID=A0A401YMP0_9ACTN|nr:S1 family peptidase [Embleya hyalina]GCD95769.1 serine protease [Embleya hyalina]